MAILRSMPAPVFGPVRIAHSRNVVVCTLCNSECVVESDSTGLYSPLIHCCDPEDWSILPPADDAR